MLLLIDYISVEFGGCCITLFVISVPLTLSTCFILYLYCESRAVSSNMQLFTIDTSLGCRYISVSHLVSVLVSQSHNDEKYRYFLVVDYMKNQSSVFSRQVLIVIAFSTNQYQCIFLHYVM